MNIFEGIDFNSMMFVGPIIVLIATMSAACLVYSIMFSWLPKQIFNFLLVGVALIGAYIWAIPMNMGFFEYFQNWGV
ncbi:hypothetical protein MUN89_15800 [Halobacillus salinarum]|uniref:Uncharacterized protein n=1 Tax=Halobacillus salinarum TaxID=2932257 RepID=A0ABY4EFX1_9BACI|nr:hypothetical protein [Halobacillus salinarum]UOQ43374.1 hypothetical protein MUN89_15800 [Halobacillus salinarum]